MTLKTNTIITILLAIPALMIFGKSAILLIAIHELLRITLFGMSNQVEELVLNYNYQPVAVAA